ncbi:hypothetical protein CN311_01725 [Mesorhizobium sanjuanii]|uniref:DUF2848 domain-containing protein n=1 Tax=Mesorhizobium sanjuanii TaxID=2037900 RepID=A0A2A6FMK3_9HYPH|nr:DUF2848 domain-containing protein [Mesorhizobium sanjuanii]PDQ22698.1 hypothetical protein CN311_01725 [Mesorhizobium sanjuanii]
MQLEFVVEGEAKEVLKAEISELVVAGWAGRDKATVEHHISELAALGVSRPSRVPLYYRVAENNLTQGDRIQVLGGASSGEVECFLFAAADQLYVTLASDHTDRELEAHGVAQSKQVCPKPIARTAWRYNDIADHWDELYIRSWIQEEGGRTLYQEGQLATLLRPDDLIAGYGSNSPGLSDGTGLFCGTVGVIGRIRPSSVFEMELCDPRIRRSILHSYSIQTLPLVA